MDLMKNELYLPMKEKELAVIGTERKEPLTMPKVMDADVSQRLMAGTTASLNGEGNKPPVALSRRASGSMVRRLRVTTKTRVIRATTLSPMRSR